MKSRRSKIGDTLYLCTPHNIAIALDPVTGSEKWRFDPKVGRSTLRQHQTCRGVSYYRSPNATAGAACSERIILPTADAKLYALDASNGQICPAFGQNGAVDLWTNMPNHSEGAARLLRKLCPPTSFHEMRAAVASPDRISPRPGYQLGNGSGHLLSRGRTWGKRYQLAAPGPWPV